jgi:imidazole glycerol phosphate synthase subunit HisF
MPMKRLILSIIYADGQVCISRNYSLQRLGGFEWMKNIFHLTEQSIHVDEITIINASRIVEKYNAKSVEFISFLQSVLTHTNLPLAVGGLIRDTTDVDSLFASGADRIVIRSRLGHKEFINL